MITIAEVTKRYGELTALDRVSLTFDKGERVAFVGANGSGKTTLLRVLLGLVRFEGQVTVFDPKNGPTYRDMLPEPPPAEMAPSCAEAGVLGALPGIIGTIQAVEAIKLILGAGSPLIGRYLTFDALDMEFREYKIRKDPNNQVTWENRDQIQVVELEGLCQPAALVPPAA